MKKNTKLETKMYEMGQLIDLGKDEVKYVLKSKKNIVVAGALAFFAFIFVETMVSPGRYGSACISDFIHISKFL